MKDHEWEKMLKFAVWMHIRHDADSLTIQGFWQSADSRPAFRNCK